MSDFLQTSTKWTKTLQLQQFSYTQLFQQIRLKKKKGV